MHQTARLARRRNPVIPAPRDVRGRLKAQDAICQRIALMMVEEQPPVQLLFLQFFLNSREVHFSKGSRLARVGGAVARLTTTSASTETPSAGYTASTRCMSRICQATVITVPKTIELMAPALLARFQK